MKPSVGDTIRLACLTVLGSGLLRPAPGTWGSATAVVLFLPLWVLFAWGGAARAVVEVGLLGGILLASWLSVLWGAWAVERLGGNDPKPFVLDEFAGQWVALLVLPSAAEVGVWGLAWVVGGQFVLFRLLDIIKPPPARWCERLPAGWGILVDDLWAGAYANLLGQILWRCTPLAAWLHLAG